MKIGPVWAESFHADGRTDMKLIFPFRISAKVLKVTAHLKILTCFPRLFWFSLSLPTIESTVFQCRHPSYFPYLFHFVLTSVMWKILCVLFPNVSRLSPVRSSSYHKKIVQKGPPCTYRGADKSLARPTSRCILFDGENISFDASLVIYINSRILIFLQLWL